MLTPRPAAAVGARSSAAERRSVSGVMRRLARCASAGGAGARRAPAAETAASAQIALAARLTQHSALRSYARMLLEHKRVIVTGGASGIGAATVRAYVREGARVVSLDVNAAEGERVAADAGRAATFVHCDIGDRQQVFDAFARAVALLGGLDVMANVAGVERRTPAEDIPDDEWDLVFGVNVKGTLYTNQAAFRHMRQPAGASSTSAPAPASAARRGRRTTRHRRGR